MSSACYEPSVTPAAATRRAEFAASGNRDRQAFARALHAVDRLDRIVLDEAHLLLTAGLIRGFETLP